MFRIAFDPDLPLVATSAFPDGTVAAGEAFDWRAKGMQTIDVLAMFRSGLLTHAAITAPVSVEPAVLEQMQRGASEAAPQTDVQPVAQAEVAMPGTASAEIASKLTRAERRALRRQG